ncbi:MAG: hypothetical protein ACRDJN_17205 [Chloroflexota bacterium]
MASGPAAPRTTLPISRPGQARHRVARPLPLQQADRRLTTPRPQDRWRQQALGQHLRHGFSSLTAAMPRPLRLATAWPALRRVIEPADAAASRPRLECRTEALLPGTPPPLVSTLAQQYPSIRERARHLCDRDTVPTSFLRD